MKILGLIIPYDYKLLSIAAILDVFETVNRLYSSQKENKPFQIRIFQTPEQLEKNGGLFNEYKVEPLESNLKIDVVLIPSFTTENISDTIHKNNKYIPWLQKQYRNGAEIASFCTGAFLFGASGLLNGKTATTHIDACKGFAEFFPEIILQPEKVVTIDGRLYTSGGSTSTFHLSNICNR